jgi:hypothetical protein
VVGPSVLGWVQVDLPVQILALLGLAFLVFHGRRRLIVRRRHSVGRPSPTRPRTLNS